MYNFDFSNFDKHFQKISTEIDILLNEINEDDIPSREELIKDFYFRKLGEFEFFVNSILKGMTRIPKKSKKKVVKSRSEKIKSYLDKIESDIDKKDELLRKIFSEISEISEEDKNVLLISLSEVDISQLKKSVFEILSAFFSESE